MVKRMSKRLLSIILTLCLIVSVFSAAVAPAAAAEKNDAAVTATASDGSGNEGEIGQFTADQMDTTLLVQHTGKTSEVIENTTNSARAYCDPNAYSDEEYSENFYTLSCEDGVYDDLGYNSSSLKSKAKSYAADPNCQNPLAGLSFLNPNEMLVGEDNRKDKYETYFTTYEDESIDDPKEMKGDNLPNNEMNMDPYHFHDDDNYWNTQCSTGVPIDIDGDGTDELAYFSLCEQEDKSENPQPGSYIRVQLYDRIPGGDSYVWNKMYEFNTYMYSDNYVYGVGKIPVNQSKGYLALAAGDYNGDGKEDLAYYMPDKGANTDAKDARVEVVGFNQDGSSVSSHYEIASIRIQDFTSDYGKMGSSWHLPTVALSTTSTRLGDIVNPDPDTKGAKRYKTYDDLVITVSVPREYKNKNLYMNSITQIHGLKDGSFQKLFTTEYKPFDENTKRMNYINTCDADLNGDGFKEIAVAGLKEYNMTKPSEDQDDNRYYGNFDLKHNYVNIISYNKNTEAYELVWAQPKEVDAPGINGGSSEIGGANQYNSIGPIAMCSGRFYRSELGLKEQLCIQGVILDCENTQMTGKPLYTCSRSDGTQINYIPDTLPGYDTSNFPYGDNNTAGVTFADRYIYDLSKSVCSDSDKWIESCASGRFFNETDVDQIALISSDPVDGNVNKINLDISIISLKNDNNYSYQAYNDYSDNQHIDEQGTSLWIVFLDCEDDAFSYRWMGSYCSYSSPVLYSIVQTPPYYKEANSYWENTFSIVTGNSEDSSIDGSVGVAVGSESETEVKFGSFAGFKVGAEGEAGLNYVTNKSWSSDREITQTITIRSDEDTAVCYVKPLVVNVYEVYYKTPSDEALAASDAAYSEAPGSDPSKKLEHDFVQVNVPQEPIFTTLTLSQYNDAVQKAIDNYQDGSDQLNPAETMETIDPATLPNSCGGDAAAYNHTLMGAVGQSSYDSDATDRGTKTVAVVNNNTVEMIGADLDFSKGEGDEQGFSVDASITVKIGAKVGVPGIGEQSNTISGTLSDELGYTHGTANTNGVAFGTTYYPPTAEHQLLGEVSFPEDIESYDADSVQINHYNVETGTWYNYDATSVCYKTNYTGGDGAGVFALGFYTVINGSDREDDQIVADNPNPSPTELNYMYPPEPPEDFAVQSMRKNDDGSLDVTLIWKSENRNGTRKADGYNIYMNDSNANMNNVIHLLNKNSLVYPSQNSSFTTASFHLDQNDYPDSDINFYIAPAYLKTSNGANTVLEGTLSAKTTIEDPADVNKGMIITKQPKNYWMAEDDSNETATFRIEAVKDDEFPSTDDVRFYWQEFDKDNDEWTTVKTDTVKDTGGTEEEPQTFSSTYTVAVNGADKDSYLDKGIRCIVNCSNNSKTSDIVSFYYLSNNQYILGDADGDRAITAIDTTYIQRDTAMMKTADNYDKLAADVDEDGIVSVLDSTWIQRYLADMNTRYDIGGVRTRPE